MWEPKQIWEAVCIWTHQPLDPKQTRRPKQLVSALQKGQSYQQGAGHFSQKVHRNDSVQDTQTKHKCVQRYAARRNRGLCIFLWSNTKFHSTNICNSGISRVSRPTQLFGRVTSIAPLFNLLRTPQFMMLMHHILIEIAYIFDRNINRATMIKFPMIHQASGPVNH